MGKVIIKNVVDPRPGYFYYLTKEGHVGEAKRNTAGGTPGRKVKSRKCGEKKGKKK